MKTVKEELAKKAESLRDKAGAAASEQIKLQGLVAQARKECVVFSALAARYEALSAAEPED